jgi:hypothetical protein
MAMPSSTGSPTATDLPTEKQREDEIRIQELYGDPGGGY